MCINFIAILFTKHHTGNNPNDHKQKNEHIACKWNTIEQ